MQPNESVFSKEEIIKKLKEEKTFLTEKYDISEIGLFGSYVRNEQGNDSDLDVLISYNKSPDFFKFLELEEYLSDLLNIKVDLVTKNSLKPIIAFYVNKEVVYV
ncbi:MAG: nucleotidyltransferase family protein [Bacteroidota bacterium]|jgi:hypothetical protein